MNKILNELSYLFIFSGNMVFSLLFSCFRSCRISLYYPEGSLTSTIYFDKIPDLSDGNWHKMVLHIQTNRMGKHVVSLFMDCRSIGRKKISSGLDELFPMSNEKVKYALRFAQRGASNSVYIPWKVRLLLVGIFTESKRPSILDSVTIFSVLVYFRGIFE